MLGDQVKNKIIPIGDNDDIATTSPSSSPPPGGLLTPNPSTPTQRVGLADVQPKVVTAISDYTAPSSSHPTTPAWPYCYATTDPRTPDPLRRPDERLRHAFRRRSHRKTRSTRAKQIFAAPQPRCRLSAGAHHRCGHRGHLQRQSATKRSTTETALPPPTPTTFDTFRLTHIKTTCRSPSDPVSSKSSTAQRRTKTLDSSRQHHPSRRCCINTIFIEPDCGARQ